MSMTIAAADPYTVHQQFQNVINDMVDANARLDQLSNTNKYPSKSWSERFQRMSAALDDARLGFFELTGDRATTDQLGAEVRQIARSGGILLSMSRDQSTFGNWRNTLTDEIRVARQAADKLIVFNPPQPPNGTPVPPNGTLPGPVGDAVSGAAELVRQSLDAIRDRVPADDRGSDSTKDARIYAFDLNKQAQARIEPYFETADAELASRLRSADASLEDAAWQLAKKPSPDGRFNGVDVPGAIRDTEAALEQLEGILSA